MLFWHATGPRAARFPYLEVVPWEVDPFREVPAAGPAFVAWAFSSPPALSGSYRSSPLAGGSIPPRQGKIGEKDMGRER